MSTLTAKLRIIIQKHLRKIVGGVSLTTALFVFQACYGCPQDFGLDTHLHGVVVSKETGDPIEGIKVSIDDRIQYDYTDENGQFTIYTEFADSLKVIFSDTNSYNNSHYQTKDTTIAISGDKTYLNISLGDLQ